MRRFIPNRPSAEHVTALYQSGKSLPEIADLCGMSDSTARRMLLNAGVKLRTMSESWSNALATGRRKPQVPVNERPLLPRFWSGFDRMPNGCWVWKRSRRHFGYGIIRDRCKVMLAHRLSWEIHNGPIPHGLFVLHKCDNPPCVNPDHLFLGTQADNMADMDSKNRRFVPRLQGEQTGRVAKLTNAQAREVYDRLRRGERGSSIARRFNVSHCIVSNIKRGKTWKGVIVK